MHEFGDDDSSSDSEPLFLSQPARHTAEASEIIILLLPTLRTQHQCIRRRMELKIVHNGSHTQPKSKVLVAQLQRLRQKEQAASVVR